MRLNTVLTTAFVTLLACTTIAASPEVRFGFIPNRGQFVDPTGKHNDQAEFLCANGDLIVQLRKSGFSFEARRSTPVNALANEGMRTTSESMTRIHRIDVELVGADPMAVWQAHEAAPDPIHYYTTGTGLEGITHVPHYGRVICRDVYPGIDIEFRTVDDPSVGIKYDWIIRPGGDPADIKLRYHGAKADLERIAGGSRVIMSWADGSLRDDVPRSYWLEGRRKHPVDVVHVRHANGLIGFKVNSAVNTKGRTLVIDPIPALEWATYYGAPDHHGGSRAVAMDGYGNTLMAGQAALAGLATFGAHDITVSGSGDALLVKFNSTGQRLWATYYGGTQWESANAVAADANGNVYLAGETWSTNAIASSGAFQTTLGGDVDAFLVKFNANGIRQWGTYFGGIYPDYAHALTIDGAGQPVIGGRTFSSGLATSGAADVTNDGTGDGFIAKFTTSGSREWTTYLGGTGYDGVSGLSNDGTFIFAAGSTGSSQGIATSSAHDVSLDQSGGSDGFLVKYSGFGQKLWGTYYGGEGVESLVDCAAEQGTGVVYLSGTTTSTSAIGTLFAHQPTLAGMEDGFLIKFNSSGVRQWGTYVGGAGSDRAMGVVFGSYNRIYLAGSTTSTSSMATTGAYQSTNAGFSDAFLSCFSTSGARLWGTYFGGEGVDEAVDLAVSGLVVAITGNTTSNTGISTPGAFEGPGTPSAAIRRFLARFNSPLFLPKTAGSTESDTNEHMSVAHSAGGILVRWPFENDITGAQQVTLRLTDAAGRVVSDQRLVVQSSTFVIPLPAHSAGAYLIQLEVGARRWTEKLIIE